MVLEVFLIEMKYFTCIKFFTFQMISAIHPKQTFEWNENHIKTCPIGYYSNTNLTSYNTINCKSCVNITPIHEITFWTTIVMIFLIFDIIWIYYYTNRRMTKNYFFVTIILLGILTKISLDIIICNKPVSMLMIKNYILLLWIMFLSYIIYSLNMIKCSNL